MSDFRDENICRQTQPNSVKFSVPLKDTDGNEDSYSLQSNVRGIWVKVMADWELTSYGGDARLAFAEGGTADGQPYVRLTTSDPWKYIPLTQNESKSRMTTLYYKRDLAVGANTLFQIIEEMA